MLLCGEGGEERIAVKAIAKNEIMYGCSAILFSQLLLSKFIAEKISILSSLLKNRERELFIEMIPRVLSDLLRLYLL